MRFQRESCRPHRRRISLAHGLVPLLVVLAVACGRDEEPSAPPVEPATSEVPATAEAPTAPDAPAPAAAAAPPPTVAEITALAQRFGVGEPVARALLIATGPLHASPSERDERLVALAGELAALEGELQSQGAVSEAARNYVEPAVAALRAGDFAVARTTLAEAATQVQAGATSSDPGRAKRSITLRAQSARVALLQGRNAEAAEIFEQTSREISPSATLLRAQLLGLQGIAQFRDGALTSARKNLEQSVRLRKGQQGNEHPEVAAAFERLADCYRAEGEYAKAEILYQRALVIWQKDSGVRAGEITRTEARIADMERQAGQGSTSAPSGTL